MMSLNPLLLTVALCCVTFQDVGASDTLSNTSTNDSVTTSQSSAFIDVILGRSRRQANGVSAKAPPLPMTYAWASWQPNVQVTCPGADKALVMSSARCEQEHARLRQTRKCEAKKSDVAENVGSELDCGNVNERNITCGYLDICTKWGPWNPCNSPPCKPAITEKRRYSFRERICDSAIEVPMECTVLVKLSINPRVAVPGGPDVPGENPGVVNPPPPQDTSTSTKIIAFSAAGVIMVALLGFAATRLSRTVKLGSRSHSRGRNLSSTVEANDIQYTSINRNGSDADPSTPRVVLVNQGQAQPIRRQGRRLAPPSSNLSIIREEETDDVFEEDSTFHDVSYDDVTVHDTSQTTQPSDCHEALEFMDEVISQIENTEGSYHENGDVIGAVSPEVTSEYRHSGDPGLLTEFGWSPRTRYSEEATIERLRGDEGGIGNDAFLSASALSLASAALLEPGKSPTRTIRTSSVASTCLTDEVLSECGSLSTTSSLRVAKRVPSRLAALKHFASMPDMTKARETIPDVDEVLAGSIDWREY